MSEAIDSHAFPSGLVLTRHYDPTKGTVDVQCGSLAMYQSYLDQLSRDSYEYFNQADGTNKLDRCIELAIYSRDLPFPNPQNQNAIALTHSLGNYRSRIDMQYFEDSYGFPAALSHEKGHAIQHWMGIYGNDATGCEEIAACWEKMINSSHVPYKGHEYEAPWSQDPPWEQLANTMRVFFGTTLEPGNTRGMSPPSSSPKGTRDAVIQGFENPKDHPDWKWAFQLAPETCAMMKAYGVKPGTVSWGGSYWLFQIKNGSWVYQDGYNSWHRSTWQWWSASWSPWTTFSPSYTRV